jgi:hypothetical protein
MTRTYQLDCSLAKETAAALDVFTRAYIETAFWLLTDENGDSLNYLGLHDLAPEALASMRADCADFQAAHWILIADDPARAGHDFWLTRNYHGAGFWDGDWPETIGRRLTEASHAYGSSDLYVGDNNLVYVA